MAQRPLLLLLSALSLGCALPAQAQWYVGANAGAAFQDDPTFRDGTTSSAKLHTDTGYAVTANGGYDFGGPKLELELGYRDTGISSRVDPDDRRTKKSSGGTTSLSIMTNGLYSFLPNSSWHPFLGAGIGVARIDEHLKDTDDSALVKDSTWQFAYQGIAGLSYDVSRSWAVNTQYRYFATLDPKFRTADGTKVNGEYGTHAVMLGVSYRFGK